MGLRSFMPMVVACPGCGRTTSTYFQELAQKIQTHIRHQMPQWRKQYVGVEEMTVAVMGCVVNGPGESKHANIGISLPGTGERPVAPVYVDGEKGPYAQGRAHRRGIPGAGRGLRRARPTRGRSRHERARPARNACPAKAACSRCRAPKRRALMKQLKPEWQLAEDGKSIASEWKFRNFYHTMSFVNAVAHIANAEDHHPDLELRLRLLPHPLQHARDRRAVGERLHLRGEDRRAAAHRESG